MRSMADMGVNRLALKAASNARLTSTGYSFSGSSILPHTAQATSSSAPATDQRAGRDRRKAGTRAATASNSSSASQRGSTRSWPNQMASGYSTVRTAETTFKNIESGRRLRHAGQRVDDVADGADGLEHFRLQALACQLFQLDREVDSVDAVDVEVLVQVQIGRAS